MTDAKFTELTQSCTSVRLVKDREGLMLAPGTEASSDFDMFPGSREAKSLKVKVSGGQDERAC